MSCLKWSVHPTTPLSVVEHDPAVMKVTDHIVDMGPRAGSIGLGCVYLYLDPSRDHSSGAFTFVFPKTTPSKA
jgi:hypothetical protein